MSNILNDDLIYLVLSIVEEILKGNVATYGQIAKLAGKPKNSRLIGKILSMSEFYGKYPCQRVVNCNGRVAPYFTEQKQLLENEGISFKNESCVDLNKHRWDI